MPSFETMKGELVMSGILGLGISILLAAILAVNHNWAAVDPHNPAAGPSWMMSFVGSAFITTILIASMMTRNGESPQISAFLLSYAIGAALGPSISTPYRLTKNEEQSAIVRYLEGVKVGLGGTLMKVIIIAPVSWLAGSLGLEAATYWVTASMALFLGISKAPVVALMLQDDDVKLAFVRSGHRFIRDSIFLTCFVGTVALSIWISAVMLIFEPQVQIGLNDYLIFAGGLLGLATYPR